jgi:hypothetical protein
MLTRLWLASLCRTACDLFSGWRLLNGLQGRLRLFFAILGSDVLNFCIRSLDPVSKSHIWAVLDAKSSFFNACLFCKRVSIITHVPLKSRREVASVDCGSCVLVSLLRCIKSHFYTW